MAAMNTRIAHLAAALALLAATVPAAAGELVAIVSARSTVENLRPEQVAAIFLGQSTRFPDGTVATAVDQPIGSIQRDGFYLRVTGKTPALLKAWWSKMIFTGRGQPPRDLPGNAAVRQAVAGDPGTIGYIDREALDPTVRQVLLVH